MSKHILIAGALLLAPVLAHADDKNAQPPKIDIHQKQVNPARSDLAVADRKFVEKAASANLDEIELSKLALQKSSNEAVKRCAKDLVDAHEKSLKQLRTLANEHDFPIPTSPTTLTNKDYQHLAGMSGDKFDDQYLKLMKKRHDQAIDDFQKMSGSLENAQLKRYADETLPTLKQHKEDIENLRK